MLGNSRLTFPCGRNGIDIIQITAVICHPCCKAKQYHKYRRNDKSCQVRPFTCKRNIRNKALVMRVVNSLCKDHQNRRHQEEYGDQTENNCLYQYDTHVIAQTKMHEHHRHHAGDGRQGRRTDLRYCL